LASREMQSFVMTFVALEFSRRERGAIARYMSASQ
jgi:hypothetical protein